MKTIITLIQPVSVMLTESGYDLEKIINACQSAANEAKGIEGDSKRSDFRGGQSTRADGTLVIKDVAFRETTATDYTVKSTPPVEFVKWHDSLANHFKKTGQPHGKLSSDMIPSGLKFWLEAKFRVDASKGSVAKVSNTGASGNGRGKGNVTGVTAPKLATAGK
jgi:hypothetical protein